MQTGTITVKLFASARDRAGVSEAQVALPFGTTVQGLPTLLAAQWPALGELLPRVRYAVNQEFATPETPLAPGDEVAVIPPVSGG